VHDCTLSEVGDKFVYNEVRSNIWKCFNVFLRQFKQSVPEVTILYIDGSFVTDELEPQDVDIAAEVADPMTHAAIANRVGPMFGRTLIRNGFLTDLLWAYSSRMPDEGIVGFFQRIRTEDALRLGISKDFRKGLLRVRI
jgi:hypothetical protein